MRRRTFLATAALALPALGIACGGDDDGGGASPDASPQTFMVENDDLSGHVHMLTISCGDLGADHAVSYVATGPHEHTIELTAADLAALAAGETVNINFTDGHAHSFAIAVPSGVCG